MRNGVFDPDSIVVDVLDVNVSGRDKLLTKKGTQYGLPCLGPFIDNIIELLSGDDEAFGRRYQRETIRRPGLEIMSPLSGQRIVSVHSIAVHGKVFYRYLESVEYYVVSSRIRFGYPLAALFLPHANCLLKWERGGKRGVQRSHLKTLAELHQPEEKFADSLGAHPVIVMGHRNFAHHMWNELSALERFLAEDSSSAPPELMVTREPLGAIDAIFPELVGWKIRRLGPDAPLSGNEAGKLFVNLAGYRVPLAMRERIIRHAKASATPPTNEMIGQIRARSTPVFWLSVRMQNPTFVNQRDVLIEISLKLLDAYPCCCILFDGFSLPNDWQAAGKYAAGYESAGIATKCEIDCIIAELTRRRGSIANQLIANIGGLGILDTIALAQIADVYFCHAGTVQHKIGWTANKPGIIHCSREALGQNPAIWHASRLEGGLQPLPIEEGVVEDLTSGRRENNYRAIDCRKLADFVANYFERCLTLASA